MSHDPGQDPPAHIGAISHWDGQRWELLTGIAATGESHEAFTALYDLLDALTTFYTIDLAPLPLASPAAWQRALVQGIEAYQQLETLMDFWANDLNNAVLREQEAQSEHYP